jgi:integrase
VKKKRWLPDYVTMFTDRHGRARFRYRRKGFEGGYFKSAFGSKEFNAEYDAFGRGEVDSVAQAIERAIPGTINDLVTRYFAVPSRLGPTNATQNKIRAILSRFREEHGHRIVADVQFDHLEAIIEKWKAKRPSSDGKRMLGGVEAGRKLRKELVRLFDYAVKIKMRADNPVRQTDRVKVAAGERSTGFHTWTEAEIAQYRRHHKLGTKARLAMELMLWTGQRRIDAIRLGPADIRDGRVSLRQSKTGKAMLLPVAPQLVEAIVAMPHGEGGGPFILTEFGKPFTNAGFGNKMRQWCDEAGLPQCSAHGLRKAIMRRLAELHMGNQSLKSVSGHSRDEEVATYTREVNQSRMADHAIAALSRWESGESPAEIPLLRAPENV